MGIHDAHDLIHQRVYHLVFWERLWRLSGIRARRSEP